VALVVLANSVYWPNKAVNVQKVEHSCHAQLC